MIIELAGFTTSMVGWVTEGFPINSEDERDRRYRICKTCEEYRVNKIGLETCNNCNCILKYKIYSPSFKCNKDYWLG